jgi:drug/metabolite transporter (DMT)-like permease
MAEQTQARPSATRAQLITAFAAVYIIWGSTFLAIRYAIETMPPLLMAGIRFVIAGAILYAWAYFREGARANSKQWIGTAIVGALLLMGGNGAVSWAEQYVPSGLAALVVAVTPLWMVLFEWLRSGGDRPTAGVLVGVAMGFVGLVLLIGPGNIMGGRGVDARSAMVLTAGTLAWAAGSIYSRSLHLPRSARLSTGMQMLAGGTLLILVGALSGEAARFSMSAVSTKSLLALLYLIFFGAIIGFTAYIWLLTVTTAARVSTYAYVNPLVALILGWALADEPITARTLLAAAVILGAVATITLAKRPSRTPEETTDPELREARSRS